MYLVDRQYKLQEIKSQWVSQSGRVSYCIRVTQDTFYTDSLLICLTWFNYGTFLPSENPSQCHSHY